MIIHYKNDSYYFYHNHSGKPNTPHSSVCGGKDETIEKLVASLYSPSIICIERK